MTDEWGQFKDADAHDEYGQFRDHEPAPAKRKDSVTLGLIKGFKPAMEKLAPYSPANIVPGFREANERSLSRLDTRVTQREETEKPNPVAQIGGNIFSTAWVPGGPLKAAKPIIQGAAQGYLLSDADTTEGRLFDAAGGAAINHFGGKAVEAAADFIKPVIEPAVRRLSEAGVKLTPGMIKGGKAMISEDKAMSRPFVGDAIRAGRTNTQDTFNTASVNEALKPLGIKVPTPVKPGHDSISYAKEQIGRAYDAVIPNLAVKIDGQQFGQNVATAARNLKPAEQAHLQQIVSNELGQGHLGGQVLKDAQGEIRRQAALYARSQNANEQALGQALWAVDEELSSAMIAQNPRYAPQLQKVNQAYRGYRVVADAASRADDGLINTGQLKQSVRRGDFSKNKDATARGEAYLQGFSNDARGVIPARYPDSGTAGRSPNIFATARGGMDTIGYGADNIYQNLRLAPRPRIAEPAAKAVKRLRAPAAAALIASLQQPRD